MSLGVPRWRLWGKWTLEDPSSLGRKVKAGGQKSSSDVKGWERKVLAALLLSRNKGQDEPGRSPLALGWEAGMLFVI